MKIQSITHLVLHKIQISSSWSLGRELQVERRCSEKEEIQQRGKGKGAAAETRGEGAATILGEKKATAGQGRRSNKGELERGAARGRWRE